MLIRHGGSAVLLAAVLLLSPNVKGDEYRPPALVKVQPVFYVPKGEQPPTDQQAANLLRHLKWAQARYKELLGGRDTFTLAEGKPQVYRATQELVVCRQLPEGGAPEFAQELMRRDKCNRYNCPNIFVVILMNPQEDNPCGGARPFNGGFNTGGGIVIMSSCGLDQNPCFQSTLQHELGHAFGLPHIDVYSYDMDANPSLMSYNPGHHTSGFQPSATPGAFIPEDVRALALNRRAFPHLRYNAETDCPKGYAIAKRSIALGPMHFPGEPEVVVTTKSGAAHGSSAVSIVQGYILPDEKVEASAADTEAATFDPAAMWQSERTSNGWASVQIAFPFEVELTKVAVHSQHGGKHHAARAVRIAVKTQDGFHDVVTNPLGSADAAVSLPPTKAQTWEFSFKAGESRSVVIRGLQFFSGDDEIFPPLLPFRG